jgi:Tannase and feruloyl esterase
MWITGTKPGTSSKHAFAAGIDYKSFNFDRDLQELERDGTYSPGIPKLTEFKNQGGKLILYHGWSDPAVPPNTSIHYYQAMVSALGQNRVDEFARLYMAPGVQHCGDGPGPNFFSTTPTKEEDPKASLFRALEQWSERGLPPSAIVATKFKIDRNPASGVVRTRPLCPYPQVARYAGSGSTDEAANFACGAPKQ